MQVLPFLKRLVFFFFLMFPELLLWECPEIQWGVSDALTRLARETFCSIYSGIHGDHLVDPSSVKHTPSPRPPGRRSEGLSRALA